MSNPPCLPPPAYVLLDQLRQGARTWKDLADAGLDRAAVLSAVGEVADAGDFRVLVGPLLVALEIVEI